MTKFVFHTGERKHIMNTIIVYYSLESNGAKIDAFCEKLR